MPRIAHSRRAAALIRTARWSPPRARWIVIAVITLALAACSGGLAPTPQSAPAPTRRPQPTPIPRLPPPTLAEAEAVVGRAAAATELRWEQSFGGMAGTDYANFTLTLADQGFRGELKVQDGGVRQPARPLESPPEAVERFLLAVAAAPVREGELDFGTEGLDYFPRVSFEFTTATDTVFFDCTSLPAECVTWNVWIIPGRRTDEGFPIIPRHQPSARFLSTDIDLRVSLELLLRDLGVATFRDQAMPR